MNILPKGCIFDLDGVICDTAKYHYLAWKRLADKLGIPFTEADNERLKGVSRMDSLKILLSLGNLSFSETEMLALEELKNNWYKEFIGQISSEETLDGVMDFLLELRDRHIKIALGSVSKNAAAILENLKLKPYFDAVIDGTVVTQAKPNPEVFLAGAQSLSLAPQECLVFEDAVSGIAAAHNANMRCIGIGNPTILSDAEYVIPDFRSFNYEKMISLPI